MHSPSKAVAALLATAALVVGLSAVPATAGSPEARLHVVVRVNRFAVGAHATSAHGTVTANLTDQAGHTTTLHVPIALAASKGRSCQILNLNLQQLNLVLLGLNVHLDRVHLVITGQPGGGILGSLFCKLARAKATAARAAIAHTMNAWLRRHTLEPLAFTVPVNPASAHAAQATCPVLDLIWGHSTSTSSGLWST